MMTNLFSIFDPSSNFNLNMNWVSSMMLMFFAPIEYWMMKNNIKILHNYLINYIYSEIKTLMKNNSIIILLSLFLIILMNNFIGLFPYIFTSTSHGAMNLFLAMPLWLGLMLFGWLKKYNNMLIHLVPQGTPLMLIPFMICIETISNMIRPLTLTVRLTANMIAGHLLLTLLSQLGNKLSLAMLPILLMIQLMLITLEAAVAMIQSYVFTILMSLYASEI